MTPWVGDRAHMQDRSYTTKKWMYAMVDISTPREFKIRTKYN